MARNVLSWLSLFNPTPAFPKYPGQFDVGTVDVEIPKDELKQSNIIPDCGAATIAFRIFYPCELPASSTKKQPKPVRWVQEPQHQTAHGYARYLGASETMATLFSSLSGLLYYISIPAAKDASLHPPNNPKKRWPVIVFSHGLAGSRNTYSHLCGSLASYGIIVVAPEFRDGSCAITHVSATESTFPEVIDYCKISFDFCPEVYEARDEQLRTRLSELVLIHEALLRIDQGDRLTNLLSKDQDVDVLAMFSGALDIHQPGAITWAGHSFGGTTTVSFVKSVFYAEEVSTPVMPYQPSPSLRAQITPESAVILLDPWGIPLQSPFTTALRERPMPCFSPSGPGGSALLSILSEAFKKWPENLLSILSTISDPEDPTPLSQPGTPPPLDEKLDDLLSLYSEDLRPQAHIFYPVSTAHISQSDFGLLFPRLMRFVLGAKAAEPERTLRLNVRAILEIMRGRGIHVGETSAFDREELYDPVAWNEKDEGSLSHDTRILSREQGAVRGWIAINIKEAGRYAVEQERSEREMHRRSVLTDGVGMVLAEDTAHDATLSETVLNGGKVHG